VLWRYKGADKGITNLLLPARDTIAFADRDDLIMIDVTTGKRTSRVSHKIERPAFGLINENGDVVIGGQSEIVAFNPGSGREAWRARHTPPGRGLFRTVAAIAARAASHCDDGFSRGSSRAYRFQLELVALVYFKPPIAGHGFITPRSRVPLRAVCRQANRSRSPARTPLTLPLAS
jgi:outer membrane protein assembly factor BamB